MNPGDINFDGNLEVDLGLEDTSAVYGVSEAELQPSTFDLGDMDYEAPPQTKPVELTSSEKLDKVISRLSSNPVIVTQLSRGITDSKLGLLSTASGFDVTLEYKKDARFNMFINAIAQGFLTSDNFRDTVPNAIKVHYVPAAKTDSIHLLNTGSYKVYKSTPAITAFNSDQIDGLSPLFKGKLGAFTSLSKLLEDRCRDIRPAPASAEDGTSILAFDNHTLATKVSRSRDWGKSMGILRSAGCDKTRLTKISILAKSIKDNG